MDRALELARIRRGFCAPNPSVGAVVVRAGQIIAEGYHWGPGYPHAETMAMRALTHEELRGADLYVTLEPCCHQGRMPPCTDAILERGIGRVFFGQIDPNPIVAGRGESLLNAKGIPCSQFSHPGCEEFYAPYRHWHSTGTPWVLAKLAISLDGKTAGPNGKPLRLSSADALVQTHLGRKQADAILSTARTILADNPRLDARVEGMEPIAKPLYVLDPRAELIPDLKIWETSKKITVFYGPGANTTSISRLEEKGARLHRVPDAGPGKLDLDFVLRSIGEDGIHQLWVESGGTLFRSLVEAEKMQQARIVVAPAWLGQEATAASALPWPHWLSGAKSMAWSSLGRDALLEVKW